MVSPPLCAQFQPESDWRRSAVLLVVRVGAIRRRSRASRFPVVQPCSRSSTTSSTCNLTLGYEAERKRKDIIRFTLVADSQPIVTMPDDDDVVRTQDRRQRRRLAVAIPNAPPSPPPARTHRRSATAFLLHDRDRGKQIDSIRDPDGARPDRGAVARRDGQVEVQIRTRHRIVASQERAFARPAATRRAGDRQDHRLFVWCRWRRNLRRMHDRVLHRLRRLD